MSGDNQGQNEEDLRADDEMENGDGGVNNEHQLIWEMEIIRHPQPPPRHPFAQFEPRPFFHQPQPRPDFDGDNDIRDVLNNDQVAAYGDRLREEELQNVDEIEADIPAGHRWIQIPHHDFNVDESDDDSSGIGTDDEEDQEADDENNGPNLRRVLDAMINRAVAQAEVRQNNLEADEEDFLRFFRLEGERNERR